MNQLATSPLILGLARLCPRNIFSNGIAVSIGADNHVAKLAPRHVTLTTTLP